MISLITEDVHLITATANLQQTGNHKHQSENSQLVAGIREENRGQVAEGRMQVSSLNQVTETARQIMVIGVVAAEEDFK